MDLKPRYYQQEILDIIEKKKQGRYLIQACCGAGKTFTFSRIPRQGKVLILTHRVELSKQAAKYYDCSVGFEQGDLHSDGEDVIIASIQSLIKRLDKFSKDYFDIIIIDECHRATASTYKKILDHFSFRLLLGFTATPNRSDGTGLNDIFDEIIYEFPLERGIKEGFLVDIECKRITLDYDLSDVKIRGGDYSSEALSDAMIGTEFGIAQAYKDHARGKTLIFGCDIEHCRRISEQIPGSKYLHGGSRDRSEVLDEFENGDLNCLINCMLFTEGTDIPCIETVIWARPTQSEVLYTQGVCRGARLYPGKDKMLLIDCVGASGKNSLCSAPTLIGIDIDQLHKSKQKDIEGDLFGLPDIIEQKSDNPKQWIKNVKYFDLWAKKKKYKTHNVNYFKYPNGDMKVIVPNYGSYTIKAPDSLGNTYMINKDGKVSEKMFIQKAFDSMYIYLNKYHKSTEAVWNLQIARKWGKRKATGQQMDFVNKYIPNCPQLTRLEASQVLNRKWG